VSTFEEIVAGVDIEEPKYLMLASQRVCRFDHVDDEETYSDGTSRLMTKCGLDAWKGFCVEPSYRIAGRHGKVWTPGEPCWICFSPTEFKKGRLIT
jgi:hypothetical protein